MSINPSKQIVKLIGTLKLCHNYSFLAEESAVHASNSIYQFINQCEGFDGKVKQAAIHFAKDLCEAISQLFQSKCIDMKNIRFSGFQRTRTMSGNVSG